VIVGHTRLGTLSEYQKCKFRIMAHVNTGQTYYVT